MAARKGTASPDRAAITVPGGRTPTASAVRLVRAVGMKTLGRLAVGDEYTRKIQAAGQVGMGRCPLTQGRLGVDVKVNEIVEVPSLAVRVFLFELARGRTMNQAMAVAVDEACEPCKDCPGGPYSVREDASA